MYRASSDDGERGCFTGKVSSEIYRVILRHGIMLTFLRRPEGVVLGNVLNVVDQRRVRQQRFVLVDLVDGIFERQLRGTVLLVLREDRTCNTVENRTID